MIASIFWNLSVQTANYGTFDTSMVQHHPGWCRFGVVWSRLDIKQCRNKAEWFPGLLDNGMVQFLGCEWFKHDLDLEVLWVKLEQTLQSKACRSNFGLVRD